MLYVKDTGVCGSKTIKNNKKTSLLLLKVKMDFRFFYLVIELKVSLFRKVSLIGFYSKIDNRWFILSKSKLNNLDKTTRNLLGTIKLVTYRIPSKCVDFQVDVRNNMERLTAIHDVTSIGQP